MFERFRRVILLALLLIVPLQGAVAAVHALGCTPHSDHALAAAHEHGHDHGAAHHHPDDSTGGTSDHAGHQCCHHFSAAPLHVSTPAKPQHGDVQPSTTLLELSFVLERPQRPPRS